MSQSSIVGGGPTARPRDGKDVDSLGPSDSSDTGSDVQGEGTMSTDPDNPGEWGALPVDGSSDSDSAGTGERGAATGRGIRDGADILPDSISADPLTDDASLDDDLDAIDETFVDEDIEQDDPDAAESRS